MRTLFATLFALYSVQTFAGNCREKIAKISEEVSIKNQENVQFNATTADEWPGISADKPKAMRLLAENIASILQSKASPGQMLTFTGQTDQGTYTIDYFKNPNGIVILKISSVEIEPVLQQPDEGSYRRYGHMTKYFPVDSSRD